MFQIYNVRNTENYDKNYTQCVIGNNIYAKLLEKKAACNKTQKDIYIAAGIDKAIKILQKVLKSYNIQLCDSYTAPIVCFKDNDSINMADSNPINTAIKKISNKISKPVLPIPGSSEKSWGLIVARTVIFEEMGKFGLVLLPQNSAPAKDAGRNFMAKAGVVSTQNER